jgi:hypothetical protein
MVDEASRDVPDLRQQACALALVEDSANDATADQGKPHPDSCVRMAPKNQLRQTGFLHYPSA